MCRGVKEGKLRSHPHRFCPFLYSVKGLVDLLFSRAEGEAQVAFSRGAKTAPRHGDHLCFVEKPQGQVHRFHVGRDDPGEDIIEVPGFGFEYLDGRITPKPEKLPAVQPKAKRRTSPKPKPKGDGGGKDGGSKRGSVPKVPLLKA